MYFEEADFSVSCHYIYILYMLIAVV